MSQKYDKRIKEKVKLLEDFDIEITDDIVKELMDRYPDDVKMRNFTKDLIKYRLKDL